MFGPPGGPTPTKRPPVNGYRVLPVAPLPARSPDRMLVVSVLVRRACLYLAQYGASCAGAPAGAPVAGEGLLVLSRQLTTAAAVRAQRWRSRASFTGRRRSTTTPRR